MPTVLDPFQFVLIAVAGWMNQRQLQMIEYLREETACFMSNSGSGVCGSPTTSDAGWPPERKDWDVWSNAVNVWVER